MPSEGQRRLELAAVAAEAVPLPTVEDCRLEGSDAVWSAGDAHEAGGVAARRHELYGISLDGVIYPSIDILTPM